MQVGSSRWFQAISKAYSFSNPCMLSRTLHPLQKQSGGNVYRQTSYELQPIFPAEIVPTEFDGHGFLIQMVVSIFFPIIPICNIPLFPTKNQYSKYRARNNLILNASHSEPFACMLRRVCGQPMKQFAVSEAGSLLLKPYLFLQPSARQRNQYCRHTIVLSSPRSKKPVNAGVYPSPAPCSYHQTPFLSFMSSFGNPWTSFDEVVI